MALATDTAQGEIQLAGDLAGDGGAQIGSNPQLTSTGVTPGQYINPKMTVDAKGRTTAIVNATPAEISAQLPPATVSSLGTVQIGANLNISSNDVAGYQVVGFGGTISAGTDATGLSSDACAIYSVDVLVDGTTSYTISNTGDNLQTIQDVIDEINADTSGVTASLSGGDILVTSDTLGNTSSIAITNDSMFACITGFVSIVTAVQGTGDCELSVPEATTNDLGVVQIGSGIDVTAGVISVAVSGLTPATTTILGGVIVPEAGHIDVDVSGNITIPKATENAFGVMKVGSGLNVNASGVVSVDEASLPTSDVGVVGLASIGPNLTVNAGEISVETATDSILGVVKVGTGLLHSSGVISVDPSGFPEATTSTKGVMQIGLHLNDDAGSGIVGVDKAVGNTTYGVVRSANTSNLTITAGEIDIGTSVVQLANANQFTASQTVDLSTLTSASNVAIDASLSNVFNITLGHNATLANPTNLQAGQTIVFVITQDPATPRTLSFGTVYKFRNGNNPLVSSTISTVDIMTCVSDGTNLFCSYNKEFS